MNLSPSPTVPSCFGAFTVGLGVKLVGESFVSPGISPELGQKIKKKKKAASLKLQAASLTMRLGYTRMNL